MQEHKTKSYDYKNLDLNAMGLVSLNEAEMVETEGGLKWNPVQFVLEYIGGKLLDQMRDDWNARVGKPVSQTEKVGYMAYN